MKDEIKEILDYFQKDVDKYEESKKYLMQKYGIRSNRNIRKRWFMGKCK